MLAQLTFKGLQTLYFILLAPLPFVYNTALNIIQMKVCKILIDGV